MYDKSTPGERSNSISERRGDGEETVRIFLITNNDEAARLIGSGGATVTQLRKEFNGLKLKIGSKVPRVDEQVTEVGGPIDRVTELLMKIAEITVEPRSRNDPLLTLLVHNPAGLIGTRGARVTQIRKESGATIKIAEDPLPLSSQTPVTVTGSMESMEKATRAILEFITTCEPVDRIYTPEMSLRGGSGYRERGGGRREARRYGRRGDDRWGGGGRRRRSPDRFDGGRRGGGYGRDGGRRASDRWDDRDFRDRGSRGDSWITRDYGPRGGGDGWRDSGELRGRRRGNSPGASGQRGDYDPFEPSSSGRGSWGGGGREDGGWGGPRPTAGWPQDEPRSQSEWPSVGRGWPNSSDQERGWGPSRSAGGGGGWGGPPDKSVAREYGGRRGGW